MKKHFLFYLSGFVCFSIFIVVFFQNCTSRDVAFKTDSIKYKGGENYDGKIFVHADSVNPCPDASINRSVIKQTETGYQLVKKDCQQIDPPLSLNSSEIKLNSTYDAIIEYKGSSFIFDATTVQTPADLDCIAKNIGPVSSLKIYSVTGSNGPMLSGVIVVNGVTTNLAFNISVLDTSATSDFNGSDQENLAHLRLYQFDPAAQHPDGTNTQYQYTKGGLGTTGYLSCVRPGGTL